ncbi:MAG: hypothetical protein J2P18_08815, partial [Nocardia sp.]|nr:hypothetical protein [Nocardia sp.]
GGHGGGMGGAGIGGPAGAAASELSRDVAQASKLFPRAALSSAEGQFGGSDPGTARAGAAPMAGTPGSPGAAGAGSQGQQNKEHKRPAYLDSTDHLEDALGEAPVVVRPVVEK